MIASGSSEMIGRMPACTFAFVAEVHGRLSKASPTYLIAAPLH
jgi:hypothetical protein